MTTAYGSITITDLIDTATYIYYSETSETGDVYINNWHKKATPTDKYICIYSGAPVDSTQPEHPTPEIFKTATISKFVGEDGTDGEDGLSLEELIPIYYFDTNKIKPIAPSNKITTTEDVENEWTTIVPSYKDGGTYYICYQSTYSNGQISYSSVVEDNGIGKAIETAENLSIYTLIPSVSSVNKFQEKEKISLSSNTIIFSLIERKNNSNIVKELNSSNSKITVILENPEVGMTITSWEVNKYIDYPEGKLSLKLDSLISDQSLSYADVIVKSDVLIRCAFLQNTNEEVAYAIVPIRYGTSDDMAKFAVTAASINAAVGRTKLEFNADGLIIKNGQFEIRDNDSNPLLQYIPPLEGEDNGLLKIIGSGEFSGTIHATNGDFTGKVSATTGDIGGFIIDSNGLYSKGGAETENGYDISNSNIQLLGESGRIYAENISLGTGAEINKYIQLGKAKLWNPDHEDASNKLLEAGGINLSQTGELTLDGADSKIFGRSFSITPEMATFSNINVSGKISTAVFEQNHIQSVGGSMMFKPSYKINSQSSNTVIIDKKTTEDFLGKVGDYVYLVKQDGSTIDGLIQIDGINGDTIMLSKQMPNDTLVSMIILGKEKDLIIGVNSNNGPSPSNFLKPCGFTVTEFTLGGTTGNKYVDMTQNPKVFFGDLDKSGITFTGSQGLKGFGLYSENVYLTGSLTTKVSTESESTFAGVNTLNGASATKFTTEETGTISDTSKIVFWAGSASTENEDIQASPLQVTERGSLYAAQGIFEGAIISKSIIKGTDIYAARIHGEGKSPNGLSFYDTNNGIVFYNGDPYAHPYTKIDDFTEEKFNKNKTLYYTLDDTNGKYKQCKDTDTYNSETNYYIKTPKEKEVFSIGNDGLKYGQDKYFIDIANEKIKFIGDEIQTSDYFTNKTGTSFLHLHLKDNQILGSHIEENNLEKIYANISFNKEGLSLGFNTQGDFVINSNEIQLKKDTVKINKTVLFGEQLKYEQTTSGYNLYVL